MPHALKKESETDHFNDRVSQPVRDHMLSVAQAIKEDFISDPSHKGSWPECFATPDITAIYGYHISGFIPSQLGGYEITELYRSDIDPTYHFTSTQTDAMNKMQENCYKDFARDHKDDLLTHGFTAEQIEDLEYGMIEKAGLDEEFHEYENEYFDPALLRVEMWIDSKSDQVIGNDTKQPDNVYICVGLNYRDQPYYRTKSDETLFQFNVPMAEFMAKDAAHWVDMLKTKMEGVE